ncbi:hypothetical protein PYH72_09035 [Staphylococcus delphini]|uniref:hypothetical protein n=1 Tax=Staphylococcus delphini TaxID=53344 RepID=UPI003365068E
MNSKLDGNSDIISEINGMNNKNDAENTFLQQHVSKNEKHKKNDNLQDMSTHRNSINYHIFQELAFKWKARRISIWLLVGLCVIIIINLLLILYWNPVKLDYRVTISLITVTFANLFAIVLAVFKYVFSSTKEILDYNANIYNNE